MTTPSTLPDVGIELREGYAQVGGFQPTPGTGLDLGRALEHAALVVFSLNSEPASG
jgi:hypothetical protein